MQHTDEQVELLRPITAVLKTVDGVERKMEAITQEIEGIEKVYTYMYNDCDLPSRNIIKWDIRHVIAQVCPKPKYPM